MIQANELRIGNYLIPTDCEYSAPFKIDAGDILEIRKGSPRYKYAPIPLSPDILLKCGFVNNRNGEPSIEINDIASHLELMKGVDNYYYPSITQTPQGDEERTIYLNRINSVHHLQNLFYALTGQELNIKL